MIFLDLSEGLGNQMFQYAFARKLQEIYGDEIYLDTQSYKRNNGIRSFSLEHYWLNENVKYGRLLYEKTMDVYAKSIRKLARMQGKNLYDVEIAIEYEKKGFYMFCDVFGYVDYKYNIKKRNKYILGSWMNYRYFDDLREQLIKDFTVYELLSIKNQKMLEEIESCNSVCIHIRLGDYLSPQWSHLNVCNEKYYKNAYDLLKKRLDNPIFYVFSNSSKDLKWIYDNYSFLRGCKFVDLQNRDFEDMELMKNCKHFVISNSTYSWWAQYLCENDDKIVVAPKIWSKSSDEILGWQIDGKTIGVYQDNWEIIEQ